MTLKDAVKFVPLNFEILANPVNWLLVALVVALAGVGLAAIVIPNANPEEN